MDDSRVLDDSNHGSKLGDRPVDHILDDTTRVRLPRLRTHIRRSCHTRWYPFDISRHLSRSGVRSRGWSHPCVTRRKAARTLWSCRTPSSISCFGTRVARPPAPAAPAFGETGTKRIRPMGLPSDRFQDRERERGRILNKLSCHDRLM